MFRTWEELTEVEQLQCNFSDFYKDVHGFRPRSASTEQWNSTEWLKEQIEVLGRESVLVQEREAQYEREAIAKFEVRVSAIIAAGAKDRLTALRWILDAEDNEYVRGDLDYFCFNNGLPYGYLNEVELETA